MEQNTDWRGRIETVLAGQIPDIIPAAFRLDKWVSARRFQGGIPAELSSCGSLGEVYAHLGLANPARLAKVCQWTFRSPVEYEERCQGEYITKTWHTPKGDLRMVQQQSEFDKAVGLMPWTLEYPLKSADDYPAYASLLAHTECVADYESYQRYDDQIGQAGLPMVILGPCPFHDWLGRWAGYETGYMHLYDKPDMVLEAVEIANKNHRQMWEIVANSPARLVMHGVNFDSATTPPNIYREYFQPYLLEFCEWMHASGKYVACHADGENLNLLKVIKETGFDTTDCFACAPMTMCTIEQAREVWQDRITIWGGIPSTLLEPNTAVEALETHLEHLYTVVAPGDHFITGIADQVMPTVTWERLSHFLTKIKSYQRYTDWLKPYFDALADTNVPVIMVHDDITWTSGPFLHPDWYRKYVFPAYKKYLIPLVDSGKKILFTSDGNYTMFIDDIAATGVNGFVLEQQTDMAYIAEKYGKTHVFVGNVDTRVLLLGTKQEIRSEVERCIAIGKDCPGYFIAVGNHIPSNTPLENALYYNEVYEELSVREHNRKRLKKRET